MQKGNKKPALPIVRPAISNASLNFSPSDASALEDFQERIECGIDWTLREEAVRHHKKKCNRDDIPIVTFSNALQNRMKQSILHGFLEESNVPLMDQWEFLLPMALSGSDKFTKEERICFVVNNSITDSIQELIKKVVRHNDRSVLRKEFNNVEVLRLIGVKMTTLDNSLVKFKNLNTLNLCGNFIADINTEVLPPGLEILELQSNRVSNVDTLAEYLPDSLMYLGLGRNFLNDESVEGLSKLRHISVLDLRDNDICNLDQVLSSLGMLPKLTSLTLAGNPCAVCAAYAMTTISRLPQLIWLDSREIMETDRPSDPYEPHPHDLRSAFFYFIVYRVISVPQPPKSEKGANTSFHIELELPFLDSTRRRFLMFRHNDSLIEYLPPPEDEESVKESTISHLVLEDEIEAVDSLDKSYIYNHMVPVNPREIRNYTVFESNKIQWNKFMSFQEPTVRIFCPNLVALRDTFRTVVTIRLIYSMTQSAIKKPNKMDKKSNTSFKPPSELRVTLATVKCALKRPEWWHPTQQFTWDDTFQSDKALFRGEDEGDITLLLQTQQALQSKQTKSKDKPDPNISKQNQLPENLTCYFGFGIDFTSA